MAPAETLSIWLYSPEEVFTIHFPSEYELVRNPQSDSLPESDPVLIAFDGDGFALQKCEQAIRSIRERYPTVPILVLTKRQDKSSVFALLKAGADGITETGESDQIREAIKGLRSGGMVLSPAITSMVIDAAELDCPSRTIEYDLSEDEIGLLNCISIGLTKKEIAQQFGRSVHTVDNHFRRLYEKLGVNHIGGAIGKAFRAGLID